MCGDRGEQGLHVLGHHVPPPEQHRVRARGAQQGDARARRQAHAHAGGVAAARQQRLHVADQRLAGVDRADRRELIAQTLPVLADGDVQALRRAAEQVHASEALVGYVQALLARSRQLPGVRVGLSPRAGLALLRAARAYALLLGRSHVLPEDVQALFIAVAGHRLVGEAEAGSGAALAKAVLHAVPVD